MAPERDDDTGQFSKEYTDEAFLQAVIDVDPATTSKIAEQVGCSYDLAYRRLNALVNQGTVARQNVGGNFVWRRVKE